MKASRALVILALSVLVVAGIIGAVNYSFDAQCYYTCPDITKDRRTINTYYQVAQRTLVYPQTEAVIIGSSRGETTLPLWVQEVTGKTTLNLSTAGAELATKKALLHVALEHTPVKKVIWLADYFELIDENQDPKIKKTPALRRYLSLDHQQPETWKDKLVSLQGLIDHNTTSATIQFIKKPPPAIQGQGGTGDLDFKKCEQEDFIGKETPQSLKTKINILYQSYLANVIRAPQSPKTWSDVQTEVAALREKKIELLIVIIPYHPDFLQRLKAEHPDIYERHQAWAQNLMGLQGEGVKVLNYLEGIPGDDGSPKYWNDGVHFTCYASIKMLKEAL